MTLNRLAQVGQTAVLLFGVFAAFALGFFLNDMRGLGIVFAAFSASAMLANVVLMLITIWKFHGA